MSTKPVQILLIEDNPGDARLIEIMLTRVRVSRPTRKPFRLIHTGRLSAGLERLAQGNIDLILLDLLLPDSHGLETLTRLRDQAPNLPVIILTGLNDERLATEAMQAGAQDYVVKGQMDADLLARAITYALERHRLLADLHQKSMELAAGEKRLRTIIAHNSDGLVVVDRNGIVRFANPAALRLFGRRAGELTGKPFGYPVVNNTATEIEIEGRGHTPVTAEMRVTDIEWEGEPAYLASLRDISERKQAEEMLKKYARELEERNEEVKQFASIVSHDLRAPLVNLKGFADELRLALNTIQAPLRKAISHLDEAGQKTVTAALEKDIPEALGFIDSSVKRMDRFITAVLKLSRLGHRKLTLQPVEVTPLVHTILDTLAHQLETHNATVKIGPLPPVLADSTALEQILGNILTNAVTYLDPGRPGRIDISATENSKFITLHIRDNGCGIPPENKDKVFAPFRRAALHQVPGEGMGLAYVQTLVRRHNGRIWFESEPGTGTTFSVSLPKPPAEAGQHMAATEDKNAGMTALKKRQLQKK